MPLHHGSRWYANERPMPVRRVPGVRRPHPTGAAAASSWLVYDADMGTGTPSRDEA
jgi:hypothetical protein